MCNGWWSRAGCRLTNDMIVIDELSSFKSYQAKRFRSLMKVRPGGKTDRRIDRHSVHQWFDGSLGGVPAAGHGKTVGTVITHYRDEFFLPDKRNQQQVFTYKPKLGAEEEIYRRISDITISMKSGITCKCRSA